MGSLSRTLPYLLNFHIERLKLKMATELEYAHIMSPNRNGFADSKMITALTRKYMLTLRLTYWLVSNKNTTADPQIKNLNYSQIEHAPITFDK